MHVDFWVTPKGSTPVNVDPGRHLGHRDVHPPVPALCPGGPGHLHHHQHLHDDEARARGLRDQDVGRGLSRSPASRATPNKIDEDKAGTAVIDTGAALAPGSHPDGHDRHETWPLRPRVQPGRATTRRACTSTSGSLPRDRHRSTSTLGDTSSTAMFIHLSQPYAPAGPVTFIITNTSTTMKHELVGFATKTMAADYPDHRLRGRREQDRRGQGRHRGDRHRCRARAREPPRWSRST